MLPKMTVEQMKDLDRILSIRLPIRTEERKNLKTEEPKNMTPPPSPSAVVIQKPRVDIKGILPPKKERTDLSSISALTLEQLREAPWVHVFLEKVKQQMDALLKSRTATMSEIIKAFEQSPLYQVYLQAGLKSLDGQKTESLSHEEFEAIADFRSSLNKL